jgi:hypothetical protein
VTLRANFTRWRALAASAAARLRSAVANACARCSDTTDIQEQNVEKLVDSKIEREEQVRRGVRFIDVAFHVS